MGLARDAESALKFPWSNEMRRGFHMPAVVQAYLRRNPESLGHAAVIEWINRLAAAPGNCAGAGAFPSGSRSRATPPAENG